MCVRVRACQGVFWRLEDEVSVGKSSLRTVSLLEHFFSFSLFYVTNESKLFKTFDILKNNINVAVVQARSALSEV